MENIYIKTPNSEHPMPISFVHLPKKKLSAPNPSCNFGRVSPFSHHLAQHSSEIKNQAPSQWLHLMVSPNDQNTLGQLINPESKLDGAKKIIKGLPIIGLKRSWTVVSPSKYSLKRCDPSKSKELNQSNEPSIKQRPSSLKYNRPRSTSTSVYLRKKSVGGSESFDSIKSEILKKAQKVISLKGSNEKEKSPIKRAKSNIIASSLQSLQRSHNNLSNLNSRGRASSFMREKEIKKPRHASIDVVDNARSLDVESSDDDDPQGKIEVVQVDDDEEENKQPKQVFKQQSKDSTNYPLDVLEMAFSEPTLNKNDGTCRWRRKSSIFEIQFTSSEESMMSQSEASTSSLIKNKLLNRNTDDISAISSDSVDSIQTESLHSVNFKSLRRNDSVASSVSSDQSRPLLSNQQKSSSKESLNDFEFEDQNEKSKMYKLGKAHFKSSVAKLLLLIKEKKEEVKPPPPPPRSLFLKEPSILASIPGSVPDINLIPSTPTNQKGIPGFCDTNQDECLSITVLDKSTPSSPTHYVSESQSHLSLQYTPSQLSLDIMKANRIEVPTIESPPEDLDIESPPCFSSSEETVSTLSEMHSFSSLSLDSVLTLHSSQSISSEKSIEQITVIHKYDLISSLSKSSKNKKKKSLSKKTISSSLNEDLPTKVEEKCDSTANINSKWLSFADFRPVTPSIIPSKVFSPIDFVDDSNNIYLHSNRPDVGSLVSLRNSSNNLDVISPDTSMCVSNKKEYNKLGQDVDASLVTAKCSSSCSVSCPLHDNSSSEPTSESRVGPSSCCPVRGSPKRTASSRSRHASGCYPTSRSPQPSDGETPKNDVPIPSNGTTLPTHSPTHSGKVASPARTSGVSINRRSSDSDLSITPKGLSFLC